MSALQVFEEMSGMRISLKQNIRAILVAALVIGSVGLVFGRAQAAADTVDEIHYSYGETADTVVFDWHGAENTIYYGLDDTYGSTVAAAAPTIKPVDNPGPFWEARISGLQSGQYHYKIGTDGLDHTFKTVPTGDFKWVDMGDTGSTSCLPWVAQTHSLAAAQQPDFVTHGGDISYANECGVPAVHQYFVDQQAWSNTAAFQASWGNHEYGPPSSDAPAGTPRDTLANYKGRIYLTNPQIVPADTTTKTSNPGCGAEIGSKTNTCYGEDWGYFVAGHVLYVNYPEPWVSAYTSWQAKADSLMAAVQYDPNIDFVVTYGHRPPYTSLTTAYQADLRTAIANLAAKYSPTASNPSGKYILSIGHHIHGEEVFNKINGLTYITNGGGGAGQTAFSSPGDPNSLWKTVHPGILTGTYNSTDHTLAVNILCGPDYVPRIKEPCTYGSTLYSLLFQAGPPATPPTPAVTVGLSDGATAPKIGDQLTYTATATNTKTGSVAHGLTLSTTLPPNVTLVNANGGTVTDNVVSWTVGDLTGGQSASRSVVTQLQTGNVDDVFTATSDAVASDDSCSMPDSVCQASDSDTIAATPLFQQLVGNTSVETDMTGWTGKYGASQYITVTRDTSGLNAHSGTASIKIASTSGARNLTSGFNDNPRWVTKTVAGKSYTASVWFKPTFVGQQMILRLREWHSSTLVQDKFVTLTAQSTAWQQASLNLVASVSNNQLAMIVTSKAMNANQSLYVDDLSLTTP